MLRPSQRLPGHVKGGEDNMVIYAFEGSYELYVNESLPDAENYFESIDVENDEFGFFADDGTVIDSAVRDGRVVLTLTGEQRPEDLRTRLRTYLAHPLVAMDPALADDPIALGVLLLERERAREHSGWLSRLFARRRARRAGRS